MNCCTTAAQKLRILGRSARGFRRPVMTYGCFQNREDDSPQRGFRIDFAARKDDLRRLGASRSLRGEHSEPPPGGGCGSRGSEEPQCAAGNNKSRLLAGRRRWRGLCLAAFGREIRAARSAVFRRMLQPHACRFIPSSNFVACARRCRASLLRRAFPAGRPTSPRPSPRADGSSAESRPPKPACRP